MAAATEPKFHEFDLTLTDRELEDFLSFMEHQTTGAYQDSMPQLPDAAADFSGLQLQPHSGSPSHSNSEGSESMGVDAPAPFPGSTASLSTTTATAAAAAGGRRAAQADAPGTPILPEQLPCMMGGLTTATAARPAPACDVKMEPADQQPALDSGGDGGAAVAVPVPQAAAGAAAAASPPAAGSSTGSLASPHGTGTVSLAAAVSLPGGVCLPAAQWTGAGPQLVFMPAHRTAVSAAHKQQQQQAMRQTSMNNSSAAGSGAPVARHSSGGSSRGGSHRQAAACGAGDGSSGGGKLQVSHSTVEKQRRDRLNSLIDELSDIVPPADPKYGNDSASVRRPKHVVLADTINLLRAMQTKLQLEEAEIVTLKQQASALTTMAAQQTNQGAHAAAAAAMMAAGRGGGGGLAAQGSVDSNGNGLPALPLAPEGGVAATGVLVEAGIGCLYVKVNCRDRKGLLSDVVGALKAFPVVITTAAITTTPDGKVHDVFEVRIEDDSVTAEDIQCAVHLALFAAERARSKRLRQAGAGDEMAAC